MVAGTVELADGGSLAYDDVGRGPAVTLLHPGLWDLRAWEPQVDRLVDAGFRVLRFDARGYGRSSFPTDPYDEVDDLAAILDARGVERTALVGCSMGGNVAIRFTLQHPDRVWALVPVASGLSGFDWPDEEWEPVEARIEEAVADGDFVRATDLALEVWAPLGTEDDAGATIRRIALDNTRHFELDELDLAVREDPPPITRLAEIDVPTLIVLGEADVREITLIGELLEGAIPGARIVMVPDADHLVNVRQPVAFDAALVQFLDGVRPAEP